MTQINSLAPPKCLRRSQLYRVHALMGAEFYEANNGLSVTKYSDTDTELKLAKHLAIADLSTLARTGFKGAGAPAWIQDQGFEIPESANLARKQPGSELIARLSSEELLILPDLLQKSVKINQLVENWSLDGTERTYLLPSADSHCWLALTGEHASKTLAKVCGVDLREQHFANGQIAQTSLARTNAIIIRNDLGSQQPVPCYYLFADISATEFLWSGLLDAMSEFDGQPVGVHALQAI